MLAADPSKELNSQFLDADEFSDTIGKLDVPWKIGVKSKRFNARIRRRSVADCTVGEMSFGSCTGIRDYSEISGRDSAYICLSYLKQGYLTFSQGNRDLVVERGDLLLWDGATPSMFTSSGASQFELIWLPLDLVERRVGPIGQSLGQSAKCNDGIGRMLSQHMRNLHRLIDDMPPMAQRRVLEASIDLIFACFALDPGQDEGLNRNQRELLEAAKAEISKNIGFVRLSPRSIAQSLGISVRYLQRIFAASGTTFSAHVARERLEWARRLLAAQGNPRLNLTEIAHKAGFCDLPHMDRSFKRHFGLSPSAYRRDCAARLFPAETG
ncbi:MAG: helix-turn-helix domain-containing protein [Novosphingobium sp.]